MKFRLVIGKENLKTIVSSSEIYPLFNKFTQLKGEKNLFTFLLWIVVGGRVGYQAWQEFCCVWLELVCHKCLGQSGYGQVLMKSSDMTFSWIKYFSDVFFKSLSLGNLFCFYC